MGQYIFISKEDEKRETKRFLSFRGNTVSYMASLVKRFVSNPLPDCDSTKIMDLFEEAEIDMMVLDQFANSDFMHIYNALTKAYKYLSEISKKKRSTWIEANTIYGHVENLWDTETWAGTYENYKGETRHNNMKNVLEDVLDMMRLDERFDPDQIN